MDTTMQNDSPVDRLEPGEGAELTEQQREALGAMVRRFAEGESFASIFGVEQGYLEAAEHQAYQLYRAGHYDAASAMCRGILSLEPGRYYPYLLMGDVELRQQGISQAREYLEMARERAPDAIVVLCKLGEVYLRRGERDEGCKHLTRVIQLTEAADNPYKRRAQALLEVAERSR
jgi:predicted Zn-dependent protease